MRAFFFDPGTRDWTTSIGLLVLRVSTGLMMLWGHGLQKLMKFNEMKDSFFVPQLWPLNHMTKSVSLMAAISAELGAAALLILGLCSRQAAFALAFTMTIAAFQVHATAPIFSMDGPSKEFALLYLVPFAVLMITGPGRVSLDQILSKTNKRRYYR
jgi:putative oxidoreductase